MNPFRGGERSVSCSGQRTTAEARERSPQGSGALNTSTRPRSPCFPTPQGETKCARRGAVRQSLRAVIVYGQREGAASIGEGGGGVKDVSSHVAVPTWHDA